MRQGKPCFAKGKNFFNKSKAAKGGEKIPKKSRRSHCKSHFWTTNYITPRPTPQQRWSIKLCIEKSLKPQLSVLEEPQKKKKKKCRRTIKDHLTGRSYWATLSKPICITLIQLSKGGCQRIKTIKEAIYYLVKIPREIKNCLFKISRT